MRLVNVENVTPKMTLAKPIYQNGAILLNENCNNLHKYIKRLLKLGIKYVYVNDSLSKDIKINDVIKEETRYESQKIIKETFQSVICDEKILIQKTKNLIENIIEQIFSKQHTMVNLIDIKSFDSYTFSHSVNVAVFSLLLGKLLKFSKSELTKLGIGAILHDIGKILIPENILNKKNKLTEKEYEIIKKHSLLGYNKLKNNCNLNPISRIIALYHHENIDGSGYPKGLKGNEIHKFAKVVSIADVFDALTSNRCYRKRWPIYKALDYLLSNASIKFDYNYVKKFTRKIAVYPNGITVILNNGQKAIVKEQNRDVPTRPVIKIIDDENEGKIKEELDLTKKLNLVIDDVVI